MLLTCNFVWMIWLAFIIIITINVGVRAEGENATMDATTVKPKDGEKAGLENQNGTESNATGPAPTSGPVVPPKMNKKQQIFYDYKKAEEKFFRCADRNYYRHINESCDSAKLKEYIDKSKGGAYEMKIPFFTVPFSYYKGLYSLMCTYLGSCDGEGKCKCNQRTDCKPLGPRDNEDCEVHFNKARDLFKESEVIRVADVARRDKMVLESRKKEKFPNHSSNWRVGYHYYLIQIVLATVVGSWNSWNL